MKNITYITIILVASFIKLLGQENKSTLIITTNCSNSVIFINDKFEGKGSANVTLDAGKYLITIKESSTMWNPEIISDSIFLSYDGAEKIKSYSFQKKIYLQTSPHDASVSVGDSALGCTPLWLASKKYELELKKRNYSPQKIITKDIGVIPVKMLFTGKAANGKFTESVWYKILLGSSVAFGTVAAYFKIKADKKYDEYTQTKNQSTLDEVNRFDVYSGIAFGALQINFGILLYQFLTE